MKCSVINNGFTCSSTEAFQEVIKPDGTSVWFEYAGYCGVFFWEDEDCTKEVDSWWDDKFLVEFQEDWLVNNKGKKTLNIEKDLLWQYVLKVINCVRP